MPKLKVSSIERVYDDCPPDDNNVVTDIRDAAEETGETFTADDIELDSDVMAELAKEGLTKDDLVKAIMNRIRHA
jgi:hypothetical protein